MTKLKVNPVYPLPDRDQPALIINYTCITCGTACTTEQRQPGFVPRYCESCAKKAASDRVKRWRERHPDKALQAQRDYRAKKRSGKG